MAFNTAFTKNFTERIKDFLLGEKGRKVLIGAAVAAMTLLLLSTFSCGSDDQNSEELVLTENAAKLEASLEERVAELVSQISGVGDPSRIEVMITLDTTSTRVYEKDKRFEASSQNGENSGSESKAVQTEVVLAGNSKEPLQTGTIQPVVRGVAVVCPGASDPLVCERVTNAVAKALNVGVSRVCITY